MILVSYFVVVVVVVVRVQLNHSSLIGKYGSILVKPKVSVLRKSTGKK